MKKKSLFLMIIGLMMVLLLLSACGGNSGSTVAQESTEETGIPVEVAPAVEGSISAVLSGTCSLEAEEEAEVVAKVLGLVKDIYVEEGDRVKQGQILTKLEDEQYTLEANQAKAVLDNLSNEFERNDALYKKKLISQGAYEKSKFDFQTQKSVYELALLRLNYTQIRSPVSGIVAMRYIKRGNMVTSNQPVFRVVDFDPLLAVLHVPEKELLRLKPGFPAEIAADAVPGTEFKGKIARISPVVDSATGTFKVTIEVRDRALQLKSGMFARVRIVYDTHDNAILVPKNAVITEDNVDSVYIVSEGKAVKKTVVTGYSNTSHVEIISGLEAGADVVTIGLAGLKDGVAVSVVGR